MEQDSGEGEFEGVWPSCFEPAAIRATPKAWLVDGVITGACWRAVIVFSASDLPSFSFHWIAGRHGLHVARPAFPSMDRLMSRGWTTRQGVLFRYGLSFVRLVPIPGIMAHAEQSKVGRDRFGHPFWSRRS